MARRATDVRLMAAMVAERRPITDRLVGPVNKLGGYLKALQIGRDLTNAIGGDDAAKLKFIKAAYDQQFSAATAFAATRSLQAAMGSVAFKAMRSPPSSRNNMRTMSNSGGNPIRAITTRSTGRS